MKNWTAIGAVLCALGVMTGAFGAHLLKARLGPDALGWWQTAVQYHLIHALGLLATGLAANGASSRRWLNRSAWAFMIGMALFCGSLYAMALGGPRTMGMITPLGGVALILAWLFLAAGARPNRTAGVDDAHQGE